jgi:hypothetical protein
LRNNKAKVITLFLAGMVGSGCDYDPAAEPVQRDVYSKIEDCMADWGDAKLCAQAAKPENQQQQYAQHGGHPVFVQPYYFYGPEYVPGNRVTYYDGRQVSARSNLAAVRTSPATPSAGFVSSARTVVGGRSIFGGAGRAAGGLGA